MVLDNDRWNRQPAFDHSTSNIELVTAVYPGELAVDVWRKEEVLLMRMLLLVVAIKTC